MVISVTIVIASCIGRPVPFVAWNTSLSIATGLYGVRKGWPRLGEVALARLPPAIAALAARRGYLPRSVYLLKPVVAVAGNRVCRFGIRVLVQGKFAALARLADDLGRSLPTWRGCRTLRAGEIFLLAEGPASFDSRYFGPLGQQHIIGRAFLIW